MEKQDLEYLKKLGLTIPKMTKEASSGSLNWWGKLKNIPLEKLLNSKKTSTLFALEEKMCHNDRLLSYSGKPL